MTKPPTKGVAERKEWWEAGGHTVMIHIRTYVMGREGSEIGNGGSATSGTRVTGQPVVWETQVRSLQAMWKLNSDPEEKFSQEWTDFQLWNRSSYFEHTISFSRSFCERYKHHLVPPFLLFFSLSKSLKWKIKIFYGYHTSKRKLTLKENERFHFYYFLSGLVSEKMLKDLTSQFFLLKSGTLNL